MTKEERADFDDMRAMVNLLILTSGGWCGEEDGSMHRAFLGFMKQIESRRKELWKVQGLCQYCGR